VVRVEAKQALVGSRPLEAALSIGDEAVHRDAIEDEAVALAVLSAGVGPGCLDLRSDLRPRSS
jgi:hypothetical protein